MWEDHPEAMEVALARHDALLRGVIERDGGVAPPRLSSGCLPVGTHDSRPFHSVVGTTSTGRVERCTT
jgi:hypothetical protein